MNIRQRAGLAVLAAVLGMGAARAQIAPPVLTDVAPPPAEERDSPGAIVLENSPVRAQRKAFAESSARTGVASVGRNVLRATARSRVQAELASARAAEAADFYQRGAGSLTGK